MHINWSQPNMETNTINIEIIMPISMSGFQFNYSGIEILSMYEGLASNYYF